MSAHKMKPWSRQELALFASDDLAVRDPHLTVIRTERTCSCGRCIKWRTTANAVARASHEPTGAFRIRRAVADVVAGFRP